MSSPPVAGDVRRILRLISARKMTAAASHCDTDSGEAASDAVRGVGKIPEYLCRGIEDRDEAACFRQQQARGNRIYTAAQLLVGAGVVKHPRDAFGFTPLMLAELAYGEKMVRDLRELLEPDDGASPAGDER